ncbi:MAG: gliding motility-associated C-terminal domain-containing protein [Saprospiraceae bacterium]|nr:gliding motility-associated C-terminal domain-containing protein [Candidatus Brachybacter algidus]
MRFFYRSIVLCFFCFYANHSFAQIPAPELYCIKGDTVRWDLPIISCGAFLSYDLYYALSANGPYTLLSSITNQSQTSFVFTNSPGGVIYYYMTTQAACGGQYSISSDTLDSASPLPVDIQLVTVLNDEVTINWTKGTSPETHAYVIYKGLAGGAVQAIDTVTSLNYTDVGKATDDSTFTYYITALDRCGGTSVFSKPHTTMLLKASIDTCTKEVTLDFSPYVGWPGGINYDIMVSENGGAETIAGSTVQNTFVLKGVADGTNLCIRIVAHEPGQNGLSYSNGVCLQTKQTKTITDLCVVNFDQSGGSNLASPVPTDNIYYSIKTNQDILIPELFLQIADDPSNINLQAKSQISPTNASNSGVFEKSINGISYFTFSSTDACGNIVNSNYIANLELKAILKPNNEVDFIWSMLDWENAIVKSYTLEKINSDGTTEILTSGNSSLLKYKDLLKEGTDTETKYCYRVVASLDLDCNGTILEATCISNVACVEKEAGIFMANGFVPGGYTPEFAPVFYFKESLQSYEMSIFDRYGGKIFTTKNTEKGWDGNKGSQPMPPGIYTYLVKIKSSNGAEEEKRGSLTLIR